MAAANMDAGVPMGTPTSTQRYEVVAVVLASVTAWLTAIGSLATVGTLIVALIVLKGEIGERRRRDQRERETQARLVYGEFTGAVNGPNVELALRNRSNQPVSQVFAYLTDGAGIKKWEKLGDLPPDE